MSITRRGVAYDLTKSPYTVEVDGVKYFFSSKLHKDKFLKQLEDNRDVLSYSLFKRFGLWIICNQLYDLVLYSRIEGRGFLVEVEGVRYTCLKSLKLDGVKRIVKN